MATCGILDPFACGKIPLQAWLSDGLRWIVDEWRPLFQAIKVPVDQLLQFVVSTLQSLPPTLFVIVVGVIAWQAGGRRLAATVVAALLFIGFIGVWPDTMTTLGIVLTALLLAVAIGLPLGIWSARSEKVWRVLRPVLDGMQTIPAFVYLVPIVMLFGIGNVPGVIVTVIFAVAPLIRLTNLGIRQVPTDVVEATRAFGSTEGQLLWKVQVPLALPTIMAGVNQTLMMSLSMVVIASMISVGGLGQMVLRGVGRLDVGLAAVGGLGIVMLAIVLDRMTQSLSEPKRRSASAREMTPLALLRRVRTPVSSQAPAAPAE